MAGTHCAAAAVFRCDCQSYFLLRALQQKVLADRSDLYVSVEGLDVCVARTRKLAASMMRAAGDLTLS